MSNTIVIKKRIFNDVNIAKFNDSLNQIKWDDVYNSNNSNDAFAIFYSIYIDLFESSFPIKEVSCKTNRKNNSQYVTPALKKSIVECKRL